ncbi:hypothetical protein BH10CHL1_BH10CHL1_50540 [soil metagenome]
MLVFLRSFGMQRKSGDYRIASKRLINNIKCSLLESPDNTRCVKQLYRIATALDREELRMRQLEEHNDTALNFIKKSKVHPHSSKFRKGKIGSLALLLAVFLLGLFQTQTQALTIAPRPVEQIAERRHPVPRHTEAPGIFPREPADQSRRRQREARQLGRFVDPDILPRGEPDTGKRKGQNQRRRNPAPSCEARTPIDHMYPHR